MRKENTRFKKPQKGAARLCRRTGGLQRYSVGRVFALNASRCLENNGTLTPNNMRLSGRRLQPAGRQLHWQHLLGHPQLLPAFGRAT